MSLEDNDNPPMQDNADSSTLLERRNAPELDDKTFSEWLIKKYIDESSIQYRAVWDLYIKFYTVFLTFNATAIAVTAEYIKGHEARNLICILFILQNLVSGVTALNISIFSAKMQNKYYDYAIAGAALNGETLPSVLSSSPFVGWLGVWGGLGNCLSHLFFMGLWAAVYLLPI